jgi:hypothetical protein
MDRHIPNNELRLEEIPLPEVGWEGYRDFAYSFFGYEQPGSSLSAANTAAGRYRHEKALPATLTELRMCLFFEHRRAVHYGAPTDEMRAYAQALVGAIREKVKQGALE